MWTVEALRAVEAARIADEYSPQVFPLLAEHRIEALVGDFGATAIEGPANSVIILRSALEEALRASTTHPEYADGEGSAIRSPRRHHDHRPPLRPIG